MSYEKIDWSELKNSDYDRWRYELIIATENLLTSSDKFELSAYNECGYYHNVHNFAYFSQMKKEWDKEKVVPANWISKGRFPGVWTAIFDSCNTHSLCTTHPNIMRFRFKNGFFLYDKRNLSHKEILESWDCGNMENPWKEMRDSNGETLEANLKQHDYPSHKCFYEDNNFGAVIGYSDYISSVIVLEDSIERVDFL